MRLAAFEYYRLSNCQNLHSTSPPQNERSSHHTARTPLNKTMPRPHTVLCLCLCAVLSSLTAHAAARNASQALGFFEPPFIHPALIELLAGALSDRHPNIVALDLDEAQTSNQIVGTRDYAVLADDSDSSQAPWVQMSETHAHGETTYFKYRADKQDRDGTLYLRCYSWGGGQNRRRHPAALRRQRSTLPAPLPDAETGEPFANGFLRVSARRRGAHTQPRRLC